MLEGYKIHGGRTGGTAAPILERDGETFGWQNGNIHGVYAHASRIHCFSRRACHALASKHCTKEEILALWNLLDEVINLSSASIPRLNGVSGTNCDRRTCSPPKHLG
jgi:hypothetical protein